MGQMMEVVEYAGFSNNLVAVHSRKADQTLEITRLRFDEYADCGSLPGEMGSTHGVLIGTQRGNEFRYVVPAGYTHSQDGDNHCTVESALVSVCQTLQDLHHAKPRESTRTRDAGRLRPWMRRLTRHGQELSGGTSWTSKLVCDLIPGSYFAQMDADMYPADHSDDRHVLHGAPSLALTYAAAGAGTLLLSGEDCGVGMREFDWGHLLGEVRELESKPGGISSDQQAGSCLSSVVLAAAVDCDRDTVERYAAHRQVLHALDYITSFMTAQMDLPDDVSQLLKGISWQTVS